MTRRDEAKVLEGEDENSKPRKQRWRRRSDTPAGRRARGIGGQFWPEPRR